MGPAANQDETPTSLMVHGRGMSMSGLYLDGGATSVEHYQAGSLWEGCLKIIMAVSTRPSYLLCIQ